MTKQTGDPDFPYLPPLLTGMVRIVTIPMSGIPANERRNGCFDTQGLYRRSEAASPFPHRMPQAGCLKI